MIPSWTYIVALTAEIDTIDFTEVLQTDVNSVRKNIDETKFILKYEGLMPSSIQNLSYIEGPFTYEEIQALLLTEEWLVTGVPG